MYLSYHVSDVTINWEYARDNSFIRCTTKLFVTGKERHGMDDVEVHQHRHKAESDASISEELD